MSKSTFRILFYLRKNYLNKSGKAGIMIRLTVNGDMVQFSSKLDIEPSFWDTKAGKAAGNSVKARQMNSMLEDIRTALSNHYRSWNRVIRLSRRRRYAMRFWGTR